MGMNEGVGRRRKREAAGRAGGGGGTRGEYESKIIFLTLPPLDQFNEFGTK